MPAACIRGLLARLRPSSVSAAIALTVNFNNGTIWHKAMADGQCRNIISKLFIQMFSHGTAIITNRKNGCDPVIVGTADSPGIQAFKPMDQTKLRQLIKRPVNLQRRFETVISQII